MRAPLPPGEGGGERGERKEEGEGPQKSCNGARPAAACPQTHRRLQCAPALWPRFARFAGLPVVNRGGAQATLASASAHAPAASPSASRAPDRLLSSRCAPMQGCSSSACKKAAHAPGAHVHFERCAAL
jgi:hypothetical protein